MPVSLRFDGMEEFRQALQRLPEDLAAEAAHVVIAAAEDTGQGVSSNYPVKTGNLQRGVRVKVNSGSRFGASATVVSASPHAHLFENGTQTRQTQSGANRGQMPKGPENQRVIPRAIRARKRMTERLIQIVQDAGLTVSQS